MFGKIYKEAVNECKPNEQLKNSLLLKASQCKKKKIGSVYKYSLSAAAIIVMVISFKYASDINPVKTDYERQFSVSQSKSDDSASSVESRDSVIPDKSLTEETPTPSQKVSDFSSKSGSQSTANIKMPQQPANKKSEQNIKNEISDRTEKNDEYSAHKESDKGISETELEPAADTEIEHPALTESDSAYLNVMSAQTFEEDAATDKTAGVAVQRSAMAESSGYNNEIDGEQITVRTSDGGSGGGANAAKMMFDREEWTVNDYFQYIGINLFDKLDGMVSQQSTVEMTLDESGMPVNDEWTFIYNGYDDPIEIKTSKKRADSALTGELTHINSIDVYCSENVCRFVYQGVYFEIKGMEYQHDIIEKLTN